jgi:3-deoxy-D-manno-octulosonic-acid transferase
MYADAPSHVPHASPSAVWRIYETACRLAGVGMTPLASAMASRAALTAAQVDAEWRGDALARTARAWPGRPIVVHAVSLGELNAALALVTALRDRAPDVPIVATVGTADARQVAGRLARAVDTPLAAVSLLPWDGAARHGRWLDRVQPLGLVLIETELWPGLLQACARRDCAVAIVNGRLDGRAARRYRPIARWMREPLTAVRWCGVVDDLAGQRLADAGIAKGAIEIVGDIKRDATSFSPLDSSDASRRGLSEPFVLAASTHPGEEAIVMDGWPAGRVVIAPRHRRRVPQVIREAIGRRRRVHLWSDGPAMDWDVLVVDEPGWVPALYRWAAVAVLGGTFTGHGGHNRWEALRVGCPLVAGPRAAVAMSADAPVAGELRVTCSAAELSSVLARAFDAAHPRPRSIQTTDTPIAARYAERVLETFARLMPAAR